MNIPNPLRALRDKYHEQRNALRTSYRASRQAFHNLPNASHFQKANGAKLESGHSGIIPFVRTKEGHVLAPGSNRKSNFKK